MCVDYSLKCQMKNDERITVRRALQFRIDTLVYAMRYLEQAIACSHGSCGLAISVRGLKCREIVLIIDLTH